MSFDFLVCNDIANDLSVSAEQANMDTFKTMVDTLIARTNHEQAGTVCYYIFFRYMHPCKHYAEKLTYARSLFDTNWKLLIQKPENKFDIQTTLLLMDQTIWWKGYWKKAFRAICNLILDYKLDTLNNWPKTVYFLHADLYRILIEEYGVTFDQDYIANYQCYKPDNGETIKYLTTQ